MNAKKQTEEMSDMLSEEEVGPTESADTVLTESPMDQQDPGTGIIDLNLESATEDLVDEIVMYPDPMLTPTDTKEPPKEETTPTMETRFEEIVLEETPEPTRLSIAPEENPVPVIEAHLEETVLEKAVEPEQKARDKTQEITPPVKEVPSASENTERPAPTSENVHRPSRRLFPGPVSATETALSQSKNLRLAQERITDLEHEIEESNHEKQQLLAAASTLEKRCEELSNKLHSASGRLENKVGDLDQEKKILLERLNEKTKKIDALTQEKDHLETQMNTSFHKIRGRERELENRLELMKAENLALLQNKDQMILDLKKQLEDISVELENFKIRGAQVSKQLEEKKEILRRTVRTLKTALSMLESEEDTALLKKIS